MIWQKRQEPTHTELPLKEKQFIHPHTTDKDKIIVKGTNGPFKLKMSAGRVWLDEDITLSPSDLDTGSIQAGKDYNVFACYDEGQLDLLFSLASTYPAGYAADTSLLIGGFHTECADVGTITGHPLSGYLAGHVLPKSCWDLRHRAKCMDNRGLAYNSELDLWIQIYLASDNGAGGVQSVYNATILDTIDWNAFVDKIRVSQKMRLLTDHEFQIAAEGSNEKTNIEGSADPVTTGAHVDTAGRRMISNDGLEDMVGVMNQYLLDQSYRYDVNAANVADSAASATTTVYHSATPWGGQLYVKWDNNIPYLCASLPGGQDKVITFGTNQKFIIKHDANANTGLGVYIQYNATNAWEKLLVNNTLMGKDVYVETNFPAFQLKLKHDASASTNGVALYYDDTDNRLEANLPNAANTTFDLSTMGQNFTYYSLQGNKGSIYKQGVYGDVKLAAGGAWAHGTAAGSRCRHATYYRWYTSTAIGGRFASEPL